MVRPDTSSSAARAWAVIRPRAWSSSRIETSRLARTPLTLPVSDRRLASAHEQLRFPGRYVDLDPAPPHEGAGRLRRVVRVPRRDPLLEHARWGGQRGRGGLPDAGLQRADR